jgi:hypothetical protein
MPVAQPSTCIGGLPHHARLRRLATSAHNHRSATAVWDEVERVVGVIKPLGTRKAGTNLLAVAVKELQVGSNATYSRAITTTIARWTPPVSLTSSASYVLPGQQTSLNMVVVGYNFGQSGYLRPSGTVQFFTAVDGGSPRAITPATDLFGLVQPPWNAAASVRVTLPKGKNVVTATYSGDPRLRSCNDCAGHHRCIESGLYRSLDAINTANLRWR